MFSECLLDSAVGRRRRGWSSVFAWALEAALTAVTIMLPLWHTEALPHFSTARFVFGPPAGMRSEAPANTRRNATHPTAVVVSDSALHAPIRIPQHTDMSADPAGAEVEIAGGPVGVPGGIGNGTGRLAITDLIGPPARPVEAAPAPAAPQKRVIVSTGVSQGYLLRQVQPQYPAMARTARIEGTVVLNAVISRDGTVENLRVAGGHPMLVRAAIDAVRQWKYRPYLLNGVPVEVETDIRVNFTLDK